MQDVSKDTSTPEHGVRFELTLASQAGDGATYRGLARSSGRTVSIAVEATAARADARLESGEPDADTAAWLKAAAALVRAATKAELAAGQPIPRKIVRWRELRLLPS